MSVINTNCLHDGAVYETIVVDQVDYNETNDYEPTNIEELAEDIMMHLQMRDIRLAICAMSG